MKRRRQSAESGFAMLFVFLMAAAIAISMLMQLPRVAFETARNREETLIQRGEQYKRAIALYFRKTNRLPAKIEDLESTNNVRFLRRRYIDPMTGKDEWRIIHAGAGGVLTDSLIQKAPGLTDGKDGKSGTQSGQNFGVNPGNSVGTGTATGTNAEVVEVNKFVLQRPSDRVALPAGMVAGQQPLDPSQPGNIQQGPIYPGQPGYPVPGTPGYTGQAISPGQPGYPAQTAAYAAASGQPIFPGQPGYPQPGTPAYTGQPIYPGQQGYPNNTTAGQPIYPGQPGYPMPGQPGYTGQPIYPGQPGYSQASVLQSGQPLYPGQPGYPPPGTPNYTGSPIYPGQPGYPQSSSLSQSGQPYNPMQNTPGVVSPQGGSFNQPGMPQQGANPSAVGMINDLLRNPRTPPAGIGSAFNNSGIQGGIAGVASTFKGPSIKIYKERQKYQEWEFVYDIKDDPYLKRGQTGSQAPTGLSPTGLGGPQQQPQQQRRGNQ